MRPVSLVSGIALLAVSALAQAPLHLIPMPRETRETSAPMSVAQGIRVVCEACSDPGDSFAAQDLRDALTARGIPAGGSFSIRLTRTHALPPEAQAEGYTITPGANSLTLAAGTACGLFYAAQTAKQLVEHDGGAAVIHLVQISDWPAMKYRGLHDDLSRGPVPTLAFQEHLIQQLAAYKVNIYSPYFENTQQYASNPLPAPPGGSMSASDARALSAFAARYHVIIIPEQEAFGHLRHTLIWDQYQGLAETPHGAVLTPTQPGTLQLIQQWFKELSQLYPGPFLHIGADETIDLGTGATRADVDARTLPVVYLDFLQQIVAALQPLHRKILFWGDVAQGSPALLKALPQSFKSETIAVAWGYSPNPRGFANIIRPYSDAGMEVWVSPSINNYRQVYPNQQLGLEDIQEFTRDGQKYGATGQLNTLWDDDGESLADQNWYGILFGAAAAWQSGTSSIPAFEASYGPVFHGDSTGDLNQAQEELTAAMALLHDSHVNSATEGTDGLFWVDPWSKDGLAFAAKMRPINTQVRLHAERAMTLIAQARAAYPIASTEPDGLPRNVSHPSTTDPGASDPLAYSDTYNPANAFPSNPTSLRETNAIDAAELGARRIDFLALKFELADEIQSGYARALNKSLNPPAPTSPGGVKKNNAPSVPQMLSDINGVNGRMQDLIQGYAQLRDLYAQAWLRTNRPYALRPVLDHYDSTVALWQERADKVRVAQRQYSESRTLPPASDVGIPASPAK